MGGPQAKPPLHTPSASPFVMMPGGRDAAFDTNTTDTVSVVLRALHLYAGDRTADRIEAKRVFDEAKRISEESDRQRAENVTMAMNLRSDARVIQCMRNDHIQEQARVNRLLLEVRNREDAVAAREGVLRRTDRHVDLVDPEARVHRDRELQSIELASARLRRSETAHNNSAANEWQMIRAATLRLKKREAALDDREVALNDREADLNRRKAALDARTG